MIIYKCDICGNIVHKLELLNESWRQPYVKEVCNDCLRKLHNTFFDLKDHYSKCLCLDMAKTIEAMRDEYNENIRRDLKDMLKEMSQLKEVRLCPACGGTGYNLEPDGEACSMCNGRGKE